MISLTKVRKIENCDALKQVSAEIEKLPGWKKSSRFQYEANADGSKLFRAKSTSESIRYH